MTIRDATAQDITAIGEIYSFYVLNGLSTFEETPPSMQDLEQRRQAILHAGLPYLATEVDGTLVGYAYASTYRPRPAYRYTVEDSVYVRHDLHSKGIGTALLSALIKHCEAGPWKQMIAVIGDSGNASSIALHTRLGFEHVGILKAVGFKLGRWVDTVLMQRSLLTHRPGLLATGSEEPFH